jgi:thioredoxin 1
MDSSNSQIAKPARVEEHFSCILLKIGGRLRAGSRLEVGFRLIIWGSNNTKTFERNIMVQELTADRFDLDVLASETPVLVDFWSPSCGPCRLQDPVLKEIAAELDGQVQVKKVNVWDEPDLATQFQISAVPTLLIFKNGEVVRSLVGYHDKAKLLRALHEAA